MMVHEQYYTLIAAILTDNATTDQQDYFKQLMLTNTHFASLYQQLYSIHIQVANAPLQKPYFDASVGFSKISKHLKQ